MNKLYWAKVKEGAKIPTKLLENSGYDIYANFKEENLIIPSHETVMVPTGIACAFSNKYTLILKERGSTGTKGIGQRCGVIDSGFRGEIFVPITNHNNKDIVITKNEDLLNTDKVIVYPYKKAICQGILLELPQLESVEITYDELLEIKSERGTGMLGSSGK